MRTRGSCFSTDAAVFADAAFVGLLAGTICKAECNAHPMDATEPSWINKTLDCEPRPVVLVVSDVGKPCSLWTPSKPKQQASA